MGNHCRHLRSRRRSARGAVAIEFGLLVPLLTMLVFGLIDFGFAVNRDTMVNNAAREGVREGSLNPVTSDIEAKVRSELAIVENKSDPSQISVDVSCLKPDDSACASFDADASSGGTVVVSVHYRHQWITPLGYLFGKGVDLEKTSEMRIE